MPTNQSISLAEQVLSNIEKTYKTANELNASILRTRMKFLIIGSGIGILLSACILLFLVGDYHRMEGSAKYTYSEAFMHCFYLVAACVGISYVAAGGVSDKKQRELDALNRKLSYESFPQVLSICLPQLSYHTTSIESVLPFNELYLQHENAVVILPRTAFYTYGTIKSSISSENTSDTIAQSTPFYFYNVDIHTPLKNRTVSHLSGFAMTIPHQIPIPAPFLIQPNYKKYEELPVPSNYSKANEPYSHLNQKLYHELDVSSFLDNEVRTIKRLDEFVLKTLLICNNESVQTQLLQSELMSLFFQLSELIHPNIQLAVSHQYITLAFELDEHHFWKTKSKMETINNNHRLRTVIENIMLMKNLFTTLLEIQRLLPTFLKQDI